MRRGRRRSSQFWLRLRYVAYRLKREGREAVLRWGAADRQTIRADIASRFLQGDGIEIGALDFPLRVPRVARVTYVDCFDESRLRELHEDTLSAGRPLVVPDVVDDGVRLATFADQSLDFVIANHMLEHAEDPVAALEHQLRVLRRGGSLYLTLPDARESFDAPRQRTSVEHLLRDHAEGAHVSRREHYEECARFIEGHRGDVLDRRVTEMEAEDLRPHFHVWDPLGFAALLAALDDLPFSLELLQTGIGEFFAVLRRT